MTSPGNAHKADMLLEFGARPGVRLFNNPVGVGFVGKVAKQDSDVVTLLHPRQVAFGLCPGSGDAIGWRTLLIAPDMIGARIAQFMSWEMKYGTGRADDKQEKFHAAVVNAGGCSGIVRGVADGEALLVSKLGGGSLL